jgi:hypothetical protein
MELPAVGTRPTVLDRVQVPFAFELMIVQPEGGKVADTKPSLIGKLTLVLLIAVM